MLVHALTSPGTTVKSTCAPAEVPPRPVERSLERMLPGTWCDCAGAPRAAACGVGPYERWGALCLRWRPSSAMLAHRCCGGAPKLPRRSCRACCGSPAQLMCRFKFSFQGESACMGQHAARSATPEAEAPWAVARAPGGPGAAREPRGPPYARAPCARAPCARARAPRAVRGRVRRREHGEYMGMLRPPRPRAGGRASPGSRCSCRAG